MTLVDSCVRRHPVFTARSVRWVFVVAAMVIFLGGCGTELENLLSGIRVLPDPDTISLDVRESCEGVMSEDDILAGILAARIDRANGFTSAEERSTVLRNCAVDALFNGVSPDGCNRCKLAILDQVFGEVGLPASVRPTFPVVAQ
ncbi:MAG: hypothetical protein GXP29_11840 [Planctomycetes bacterium]|nr:hypothetical protein [Planctomycetota bacterium]